MPLSFLNSSTIQSMSDVVPVVTAEVRVAVGRLHFENAVADFEHRDIEGAAAQVIDGDLLVLLLVETVSERGRGRLVDDAEHFETGDLARVLRRVALRVVEVSRHGDDGLGDLFAELGFRVGLQFRRESSPRFPAGENVFFSPFTSTWTWASPLAAFTIL